MAIEKITEGLSGQEAADILYNNDVQNAPANTVGGAKAPSGEAVINFINDGVAADIASIGDFEIDENVRYMSEAVFRQNSASTFSGFGGQFPVVQDFNVLYVRYKDRADVMKATALRFRICDTDRMGEVWAAGEVALEVADNAEVWLRLEFPLIANPNGNPVWFEWYTNGKCDRFDSEKTVSNYYYWYKTYAQAGHWTKNFAEEATQSTSAGNKLSAVRMFKESRTLLPSERFALEVLETAPAPADISTDDPRAVSGAKVAAKTLAYDDVISMQLEETSAVQLGGISSAYNSSTFAGWGQQIGVRAGFNFLKFAIYPYSVEYPPTYYELRIRRNDKDGEVLFVKRMNVTTIPLQRVYLEFDVGTFANTAGDMLFVQINSDGYFSPYYMTTGAVGGPLYWTTARSGSTVNGVVTSPSAMMDVRIIWGQLRGNIRPEIVAELVEAAGGGAGATPDTPVASTVYLYPTAQYNIFDKNAVVPAYGDRLDNYTADYTSAQGAQFKRGYRLAVPAGLSSSVSLALRKGRTVLKTVTQTLLSAAQATGAGITRKVLIMGDSTVNGSNISTPLKNIFDADAMNIQLIGTLGAAGVKHEGRGGWTVNDYYGIGRVLYVINVSGLTTAPSIGAVYSQGGVQYNVVEVNITGGTGYFSVQSASSNRAVDASGTLTKVSGTGEASITYGTSSVTSSNPFYNPATQLFDLGYYLSSTGQSMAGGDWFFIQLGINDVFGITTPEAAADKVNTMATQLRYIVNNIQAYNPDIRVGLVVTFPPADQNAFGVNYTTGQTSEMYIKTGLIAWQKKMLSEFDSALERTNKRYLIPANLNLDTDYNYPTTTQAVNSRNATTEVIQSNGVHPAASGYAQIADMYAGAIKYFA